jgi:hypothetical protein
LASEIWQAKDLVNHDFGCHLLQNLPTSHICQMYELFFAQFILAKSLAWQNLATSQTVPSKKKVIYMLVFY